MRPVALLLLRASLGLLLVVWGFDKLRDVRHALDVSRNFYGGAVSSPAVLVAFGAFEVLLGAAIVAGVARRLAYPALLAITGFTLLAVWKSIVDPLGVVFADSQLMFFPSLIIFAAAVVVWAFREEDTLALDRRRVG